MNTSYMIGLFVGSFVPVLLVYAISCRIFRTAANRLRWVSITTAVTTLSLSYLGFGTVEGMLQYVPALLVVLSIAALRNKMVHTAP